MFDHARASARAITHTILLGMAAAGIAACERADDEDHPPPPVATQAAAIATEPVAHRPRLSFPQALRVGDESVDAFVERALIAVAGGEYEPYRLLWSVEDDPPSRDDFEQRWHGVTGIQLRALRRIILTDGQPTGEAGSPGGKVSYALLADFSFDPADPPPDREPLRGVVWVVVKEHDWRLARPPKAVKRWLREQVSDADERPEAKTGSVP